MIDHSRYYHFFDGTYKRDLIEKIKKQLCIMMGQCGTNPSPTLTSVGEMVVSGVCKAANIVKKDEGCEWGNLSQIPLKLSLPDKFQVSLAVCLFLVKRVYAKWAQSSNRVACGHVFSLQQLIYVTKVMPPVRKLKCPYCPTYTLHEHCKTVYF